MKTQDLPIQIQLNDGYSVIIDRADLNVVLKYKWLVVRYHRSYYARSSFRQDGKPHQVSMHRLLARTPASQICHHRNRNTLDNRRSNLLNMTKKEHQFLHLNNTLLVKYR